MSTVIFDPRKRKDPEPEVDAEEKPRTLAENIGIVVGFFCIPLAFMLLWNWLMPSIFGLTTIGYFKSCGLLALSFMIFRK
jgi:positive regulator of sigma E activity